MDRLYSPDCFGYVAIGIDESAYIGVVVAGLEVVEPCFGVVEVATVTNGVYVAYMAGRGYVISVIVVCPLQISPRVVRILRPSLGESYPEACFRAVTNTKGCCLSASITD